MSNKDQKAAPKEEITLQEASEQTTEIPAEPAMEQELAEAKDQLLRALAETENVRRRAQREKEEALKYGAVSLAKSMLSVLDNLQRALEACPEDKAAQLSPEACALLEGVKMTEKEFLSVLKNHKIETIAPQQGELFDPHFHQAMMEVDANDSGVGTIVDVLQRGYKLDAQLLRPAMVSVAKKG